MTSLSSSQINGHLWFSKDPNFGTTAGKERVVYACTVQHSYHQLAADAGLFDAYCTHMRHMQFRRVYAARVQTATHIGKHLGGNGGAMRCVSTRLRAKYISMADGGWD